MTGQESTYVDMQGMLRSICNYYRKRGVCLTWDELNSAASYGFIKADLTYNPDKGTRFETWVYIQVKRAIQQEMRKHSRFPITIEDQLDVKQIEAPFIFDEWVETLSSDARYAVNVLFYPALPKAMQHHMKEVCGTKYEKLRNGLRLYLLENCRWSPVRVKKCFQEIRTRLKDK